MKVEIEFNTDNAAFEDSFLMEITRVLQSAKAAIKDSENTTMIRRMIRDSNGNRIGTVTIKHDMPYSGMTAAREI